MKTAVITTKIDPKVKEEAKAVAKSLGFNLSTLISAYLRQLIRTESVHFSKIEEPSDCLLEAMRDAKIHPEDAHSFDSVEDSVDFLQKVRNCDDVSL